MAFTKVPLKTIVPPQTVKVCTEPSGEPYGRPYGRSYETSYELALACSEQFRAANFGESNYISRGKEYPMYYVTLDGFPMLVFGYYGKGKLPGNSMPSWAAKDKLQIGLSIRSKIFIFKKEWIILNFLRIQML